MTRKTLCLWLVVGALVTVSDQASGKDAQAPVAKNEIPEAVGATWLESVAVSVNRLFSRQHNVAYLVAEAVSDKAARAQLLASIALGELGVNAEDLADELAEALSDEDANVRSWSAIALGWIGPDAAEAVPLLIAALQDKKWDVRNAAAIALGRIGADARAAVPELIAIFSRHDEKSMLTHHLRAQAAEALARMGPDALFPLIQTLCSRTKRAREFAAYALGRMETDAATAVPALIEVLEHDQWWPARRNAAEALGRLASCDDKAIRALIGALQEPVMFVRKVAAVALAELGPQAEEAAPVLEKAFEHKMFDSLRAKFAVALCSVTDDAEPGIQIINDIMNGTGLGAKAGHSTKAEIADVLPKAPELGARAVPALRRALGDKNRWLRVRSAMALWRITGDSDAAIGELIPIVTTSYVSARESSARRLGMIGPEASSAVSALMEALQYEDSRVKDACAEALRNILGNRRDAEASP